MFTRCIKKCQVYLQINSHEISKEFYCKNSRFMSSIVLITKRGATISGVKGIRVQNEIIVFLKIALLAKNFSKN